MPYDITKPGGVLQADIQLPASKSICNRALILSALTHGGIMPDNLSDCDDTRVMMQALTQPADVIDIGAAGTAMRFLTAYLSVIPGHYTLTGSARMKQRPIGVLVDALRQLGADIRYSERDGFPPLCIGEQCMEGSLIPIILPGHVSSQYISALLMIGAVLPLGLKLDLSGEIVSRPYIDLTLHLMNRYGGLARWTSHHTIEVKPTGYLPTPYTCESDWSAASYWYEVMALRAAAWQLVPLGSGIAVDSSAIGESVHLLGLFAHSPQGDSRGAEIFARLGVNTEYTDRGIRLTPAVRTAVRLDEDFTDIPDLAQTFVVTCCLLGVPFRFSGLQSLRIKETDRIAALTAELRKLGYVLRAEGDIALRWDGERCQADDAPLIATYDDHRMAMAFAPACQALPGGRIRIAHPEVVSKSYPAYWNHLHQAGFDIQSIS